DLVQRLGRVAASWCAHATTLRGVDCADARVGIVERPLDALQLLTLHVQHRVRKVHQLTGVIPVPVADDDLGHVVGAEPQQLELIREWRPVLAALHLQVVLRLPAGIVQDQLLAALDDTDIDRQVDGVDAVVRAVAAGHVRAVGHEGPERHVHEAAALHQPGRTILRLRRRGPEHPEPRQRDCSYCSYNSSHFVPPISCCYTYTYDTAAPSRFARRARVLALNWVCTLLATGHLRPAASLHWPSSSSSAPRPDAHPCRRAQPSPSPPTRLRTA